jgi:hypothetical protein
MSATLKRLRHKLKAELWKRRGCIPGAAGSSAAKWLAIESGIRSRGKGDYGRSDAGIDERVVEYPWVFDRMSALDKGGGRVLDAGSVLNHRPILEAWRRAGYSPVSLVTLAYEGTANVSNGVRYEFADLRHLPYKDEWFSAVVCVSTLEHVGLDNRVYGAASESSRDPNVEAIRALDELFRVSSGGATLLLSVPFGLRSNRGWLRVFDADDLEQVVDKNKWSQVSARFFRATRDGWRDCPREEASTAGYNEPEDRGGSRTAPAYVAAAEAVALVELIRP